jgi:hypothetical protein
MSLSALEMRKKSRAARATCTAYGARGRIVCWYMIQPVRRNYKLGLDLLTPVNGAI